MLNVIHCAPPGGVCYCSTDYQASGCNQAKRFPPRQSPPVFQDPPAGTVLDEATQLTDRTRKDVYAHPSINFERIARMWSVILGVEVTAEQHALCMIAVKLSRLVETPGHRDSLIDLAGYARTIELLYDGGGE